MRSPTSTDHKQHASWKQLLVVFIIALLLFISIRMQPEPWIASLIEKQAKQQGMNISYRALELNGLSLHFEQLSIQTAQLPGPIKLDSLSLSPAWSSLLTGDAGATIQANWNTQSFSAVVTQQADIINIHSLDGALDVALLQPLLAKRVPIPVNIQGRAKITGGIQLNAINGHPRIGKLTLNWRAASVEMPPMKMPLGDYKLILQTDDIKRAWQWDLSGGTALKLTGKGNISTSAPNPALWSLNGTVQAQADQKTPTLAALLGNRTKQFSISGNISQPRLQPL